MELKDFIKGTVTAISESITELNEELGDKASVSPSNFKWDGDNALPDKGLVVTTKIINKKEHVRQVIDVEFNLSITEVKSNVKGGGVKIKVVDAGVNSKKEIENFNTVKFSIPVAFF